MSNPTSNQQCSHARELQRDYTLGAGPCAYCLMAEASRLTARVAELEKELNEWARKANDWRAKYAELRYPGMKGIVRATDETEGKQT